ncbi:M61 family metallopeptidase [Pedobacter duraquae]|uniref:Putative metalloprotease with PDZ domain n=1 Tax=Pedobacter duraquae TaxID=425511 RepID=A0A4R6IR89_9SPHI|nr:PDZ domain-containing protein [Pedobacter duraquae]TDO24721.1 putative metalloprotease with PDZ domain [Pedobacter duraquae]
MKKFLLPAFTALTALTMGTYASAIAQSPIAYTVSFPNAIHHEAEISVQFKQLTAAPLRVRMSRSSPGRYATHEFGKNIYHVKAFNAAGKPLVLNQLEGDVWEIPKHEAEVQIKYTLFGNWVDGTYAAIDQSHAHLNMPATLMWAYGMDQKPITVQFNDLKKQGWRVITQLKPMGNDVFYAANLQYLMDSPAELTLDKHVSWEVVNPDGKKQEISLSTHSDDDQAVVNKFADMVKRVVLEEQAIFGELPAFDYGKYVFLHDVHPSTAGDGMEHRNSTVIVQPAKAIEGNERRLLGTFSHEFFHSWNVERIRPKTLEPFNFAHANMSNELWFAEGFTQYYGALTLTRAGLNSVDDMLSSATGLINSVLNTPGAANFSAVESSRYAVFADANVAVDATNKANIFNSYYSYGGAVALALDLQLRSEFNLTLDNYMRQVWLAHGKTERAYTIPDLQNVLAKFTGKPEFAAGFFTKYVYGLQKADYAGLLDKAGLVLKRERAGKAWAGRLGALSSRSSEGVSRSTAAEGLMISSSTLMGTPVYKAGLDAGDMITVADGKNVKDMTTFNEVIAAHQPGDEVKIQYANRTGKHETVIVLEEDPGLTLVTYEKAGKTPSAAQLSLRNDWLSSKIK